MRYVEKRQYHNSFIVADKNEAYVLETAGKYGTKRETISRMLLTKQLDETEYLVERNTVQKQILNVLANSNAAAVSKEEAGDVLRKCMEIESAIANKMLAMGSSVVPRRIKGNLYFKSFWAKANAKLKD